MQFIYSMIMVVLFSTIIAAKGPGGFNGAL
jgi:hypothetical protein